jgi:putative Mg2+ transporter-C (MgtC) family protein
MGIEIILKLLLAAVLGAMIGLEREISHKQSGLKANVLMAVGTTLMTVLAVKLGKPQNVDFVQSPMLGHIVTALGIIGAAIIVRERFTFHGLTSAATIWTVGAIGITIGAGHYLAAFGVAIFLILVLTGLKALSSVLEKQGKLYAYVIAAEDRASILLDIKKIIIELGLKYIDANLRKTRDGYEVEIALHTSLTKNKEFIERIMQLPDVKEINSENL